MHKIILFQKKRKKQLYLDWHIRVLSKYIQY